MLTLGDQGFEPVWTGLMPTSFTPLKVWEDGPAVAGMVTRIAAQQASCDLLPGKR